MLYQVVLHVRLSSILNIFDRGKNVTLSGLIRQICCGIPTEWVEPLRRKNAVHGFNRAVIIHIWSGVGFL